MKLIAFSGKMGSGKSTAIEIIKNYRPIGSTALIKFAGPLYDIQEFIYRRISSVHTRESGFVKDRKLLQYIGTEWGRNTISDTLWIDLWKNEIKYAQENYPNHLVMCDDLRFDNEAEAVKSMGGIIIQLKTDKNVERITTANGIAGHASENGVSSNMIDHIINNNGSIRDLELSLFDLNAKVGIWK